jgi:hypothetical protein
MRVQMRLLEALVDADPDAEAKAENAVQQPYRMNQRSMFFMRASSRTISKRIRR